MMLGVCFPGDIDKVVRQDGAYRPRRELPQTKLEANTVNNYNELYIGSIRVNISELATSRSVQDLDLIDIIVQALKPGWI
jgi:hypothetical protein